MSEIKKVNLQEVSNDFSGTVKYESLNESNKIINNMQEAPVNAEEYDVSSDNLSIEEIKKLPHTQNEDGSYTVKSKYLGNDAEYTFNSDGSYKMKFSLGNNIWDERFYDVNGNLYKSVVIDNTSGEIIDLSIIGNGKMYNNHFISYAQVISDNAVISNEDYEKILALANNNEKLLKEKGMTISEFIAIYTLVDKVADSNLTDSEKIELVVNSGGFRNIEEFDKYSKDLLVKVDDKTFKTIDGAEISLLGYDKNGEPILYSYDYFVNKKDNGVYVTKSDLDVFKTYSAFLDDKNVEILSRYYKQVQEFYGDSISEEEKGKIMHDLAFKDKENGNKILYSTPILKNGKVNYDQYHVGTMTYEGEYLEYYSDSSNGITNVKALLTTIHADEKDNVTFKDLAGEERDKFISNTTKGYLEMIETQNKYSDNFKKSTSLYLDQITFVNTDYSHDDWVAYVPSIGNSFSEMIIDVNMAKPDIAATYTHELGHVYGNMSEEIFGSDIDESKEWKDIYNQILKKDKNNTLLREYAHSSATECFADCVGEYYSAGNGGHNFNSNDLKMIDITAFGKKMTLYDYMADILDGKREAI